MTVRELIQELLEFDLDDDIEVNITSREEDGAFEFEINDRPWTNDKTLISITTDLDDYVLVDLGEYEDLIRDYRDLKAHIRDLEDEIEELRSE